VVRPLPQLPVRPASDHVDRGRTITITREHLRGGRDTVDLTAELRALARPLATDDDLEPLVERIGDARYVLLGEASHGTHEYYTWRARISRRLIREKGFSFIAVEGDWPDCYRVNRYVKGLPVSGANAHDVLKAVERWPTWMWANWEIVALAEWLRRHNDARPDEGKAGFYGLDVYSLWESLESVLGYLERVDPDATATARRAFRCFDPYGRDAQEYARATDMASAGMVNVGQLVREAHAADGVVLVGFAGYRGSVIAGQEWGAPMEQLRVPEARDGSWEALIDSLDRKDQLFILPPDGSPALREPHGRRAIGIVYDADYERWDNYVPTVLPYRYDSLLYFEETRALHPLHVRAKADGEPPETYPWSV
jgi:erythromycin esterase-like protein